MARVALTARQRAALLRGAAVDSACVVGGVTVDERQTGTTVEVDVLALGVGLAGEAARAYHERADRARAAGDVPGELRAQLAAGLARGLALGLQRWGAK